jgi:hypothetical protein
MAVVKERPNHNGDNKGLVELYYLYRVSFISHTLYPYDALISQNLFASNYYINIFLKFSFKYGILEGKPVFVPTGDVIILIQMPLYLW